MLDVATLAGIAVKTSIVIVATGLLALAMRRQSAEFKHLLWTAALGLCVLMPLGVLFLPTHHVATLPAALAPLPVPSPANGGGPGWGSGLWLLGISCVLLREIFAAIGLTRWLRRARPLASPHWTATLSRISTARDLRVLESPHISSPCTWGVLRPVLLLPTSGDAWPEAARHAALMHELAHIQRRDAISTLLSRLACALHWYNPLVWLAAARVRNLQERSCDDAVLRAGATPSDYAQFLLDVAAHMSGMSGPARAAIGMTHGSSLRARIVAILDPQTTRSRPQRARLIAACTSLFVFTIALASGSVAIEPSPLPPTPTPAPTPEAPTPAIPAVPALPAVPSLPSVPATPALPTTPAVPATPPLLPSPTSPLP